MMTGAPSLHLLYLFYHSSLTSKGMTPQRSTSELTTIICICLIYLIIIYRHQRAWRPSGQFQVEKADWASSVSHALASVAP